MKIGSIVFCPITKGIGIVIKLTKKGKATVMMEFPTLETHVDNLGVIEKSVFDFIKEKR